MDTTTEHAASQQTFSPPSRWEVELEFVQSLSNIQYVYYLAQEGYLSQPTFRNYVAYLQYWHQPQYLKFLVYPNCLHVLTLLQHDQFAKDIQNPDFRNLLMNDMVSRWQQQQLQPPNGSGSGSDAGGGSAALVAMLAPEPSLVPESALVGESAPAVAAGVDTTTEASLAR